jgi:hypothetical protein
MKIFLRIARTTAIQSDATIGNTPSMSLFRFDDDFDTMLEPARSYFLMPWTATGCSEKSQKIFEVDKKEVDRMFVRAYSQPHTPRSLVRTWRISAKMRGRPPVDGTRHSCEGGQGTVEALYGHANRRTSWITLRDLSPQARGATSRASGHRVDDLVAGEANFV